MCRIPRFHRQACCFQDKNPCYFQDKTQCFLHHRADQRLHPDSPLYFSQGLSRAAERPNSVDASDFSYDSRDDAALGLYLNLPLGHPEERPTLTGSLCIRLRLTTLGGGGENVSSLGCGIV